MRMRRASILFKVTAGLVALAIALVLISTNLLRSKSTVAAGTNLPAPGVKLELSSSVTPIHLLGMTLDPVDPLKFTFLVDKGHVAIASEKRNSEYQKLIKYFLAALATPDEQQWVNLSPYETDRVIPSEFGLTDMGRDLLAQDYILKQLSSSLVDPNDKLGKKYWDLLHDRAYELYGTTEIPLDTFNKIWIVPDEASILERGNSAVILDTRLKAMMEEDYAAFTSSKTQAKTKISADVTQSLILPIIEKEVNEGEHFANLRQIVSSMVLATWYKRSLKETLLAKSYADKSLLRGIDQNPDNNNLVYETYVEAFKKGAVNLIRNEKDLYTGNRVKRHYFSGGFSRGDNNIETLTDVPQEYIETARNIADANVVEVVCEIGTITRDVNSSNTLIANGRSEFLSDPELMTEVSFAENKVGDKSSTSSAVIVNSKQVRLCEDTINADISKLVVSLDQIILSDGSIDYPLLGEVKKTILMGLDTIIQVSDSVNHDKSKYVENELKQLLLQDGPLSENSGSVEFAAISDISADAKTLNLSSNSLDAGHSLDLISKLKDEGGAYDITSLYGFYRWFALSREMEMAEGSTRFDYEKAQIIVEAGGDLRLYPKYSELTSDQLREALKQQRQELSDYLTENPILSDMHIHPTGSATEAFVLENAYRYLRAESTTNDSWNNKWGWVDKEFSDNLKDLGYASFRELVEAFDLVALRNLIGTPHKKTNKSLVEYFDRYGIIQNVNESEETVVRIARETAEQEAKLGGAKMTELRGATATAKNEELVQTEYLPMNIGGLNERQTAYAKSLDKSHAFAKWYQFDANNNAYVCRVEESSVPQEDRAEIFSAMRHLNLIGMETLLNLMANRRGLQKAKEDYVGFDYSMVVIVPKLDSVDMARTIMEEVSTLKKIALELKMSGVEQYDEEKVGAAVDAVLGLESDERDYWVGVFWEQCRKDNLGDIISAMESIVGFDTAGPEFLFYKDAPGYLADFLAEFEEKLTSDEIKFLKLKAYRGNWIDSKLKEAFEQSKDTPMEDLTLDGIEGDVKKLRSILDKVGYAGRVRFMAKRMQGVMDTQTEATYRGQKLYRESTSHAGEAFAALEEGLAAVREAVKYTKVKRIGHGIAVGIDPNHLLGTKDGYGRVYDAERINRLVADQKALMQELIEDNVAIEINISSNFQTSAQLQTGHEPDIRKHPFFRLLDAGVPLVVGTDGLLVSNTTLAEEVVKLAMAQDLSTDELQAWADKVDSRLGVISLPKILRQKEYQVVIDSVDASERLEILNEMKAFLTFPNEGDNISTEGAELAKWMQNLDLPLDIFAMRYFVLEREGEVLMSKSPARAKAENEWVNKIGSKNPETMFEYKAAKNILEGLTKGNQVALDAYRNGDKRLRDYVDLMGFARVIQSTPYNNLKDQLSLFNEVRNALADVNRFTDFTEILNTVEGIWLSKLFADTSGIKLGGQVRAPPSPIVAEKEKVQVIIDIKSITDVNALKACVANWRQSKNVVSFKIVSEDPNSAAVVAAKSVLADQYEGFYSSPDDVPVEKDIEIGEKDIIITDDNTLVKGRKNVLLISKQDKGFSYEFDGHPVEGDAIGASINKAVFAVSDRVRSLDDIDTILDGREVLPITGFTMQKFDKTKAKKFLKTLLKVLNPQTSAIMMGTNESGYDELLLEAVREEFEENGRKDKFLVVGAMPEEGFQYSMGNVDYLIVQGKTWPNGKDKGDTSAFLKRAKVIHRLGGGAIARDRTDQARLLEIKEFTPTGYGGVSKKYSILSPSQRLNLAKDIHESMFSDRLMSIKDTQSRFVDNSMRESIVIKGVDNPDKIQIKEILKQAAELDSVKKKLDIFFDSKNLELGSLLKNLAAKKGSVITPIAVVGREGFRDRISETDLIVHDSKITSTDMLDELSREAANVFELGTAERDIFENHKKIEANNSSLPEFVGIKKVELPSEGDAVQILEQFQDKAIIRLVGGAPDMSGWSELDKEFLYTKLSMFFDDLLGLYTSNKKVALMMELSGNLFAQEILSVAAQKGVDIIGVVDGAGGKADVINFDSIKEFESTESNVSLVRRSARLWDHVDASLIIGGDVKERVQHQDVLEARLTAERRSTAISIDGFGNDVDSLTDKYYKENEQPNIADARSAATYLQSRMSKWVINDFAEREVALKSANKLKLELDSHVLPLAWMRANNSLDSYDAPEMIEHMQSEDTEIGFLMQERNDLSGMTLAEHTSIVANNFESLLQRVYKIISPQEKEELAGLIPALRLAVLLHDIGKPVSHENQHAETMNIIQRKFTQWGMSEGHLSLAKALIEGDTIGQLAIPRSTSTVSEAQQNIRNKAEAAGVSTHLFSALAIAYYMADAAAYDNVEAAEFTRSQDGSLLIKKDLVKVSDLLVNLGADIATEFITHENVDDPLTLPIAARDKRFSDVGVANQAIPLSWTMGQELSIDNAVDTLEENGFSNRLSVNTKDISPHMIDMLLSSLNNILDSSSNNDVALIVDSDNIDALRQVADFAREKGCALVSVVDRAIFDPKKNNSIPRSDFWYIVDSHNRDTRTEFVKSVSSNDLAEEWNKGGIDLNSVFLKINKVRGNDLLKPEINTQPFAEITLLGVRPQIISVNSARVDSANEAFLSLQLL